MTKLEEIIYLHDITMQAAEDCLDDDKNIANVLVLMSIVKDKLFMLK